MNDSRKAAWEIFPILQSCLTFVMSEQDVGPMHFFWFRHFDCMYSVTALNARKPLFLCVARVVQELFLPFQGPPGRFAVEMSCAPSNHPQCPKPHFSVCHRIKSSSSEAVTCSEMFSFLSVCSGDLSDISLHSTTETAYSLTYAAENECSRSRWKWKVCCKIWQDYFTIRPWSSNILQNMIQ